MHQHGVPENRRSARLKNFPAAFQPLHTGDEKDQQKKNSRRISIWTGKKFPTTTVNKRQLWKRQRKKEVFAPTIQPSGSQHKWRLTFPTSSSGTWLPCMPAQLHINYFPYYFHINKFCCFQGDGSVDTCKEGSVPKQIIKKGENKEAEYLRVCRQAQ